MPLFVSGLDPSIFARLKYMPVPQTVMTYMCAGCDHDTARFAAQTNYVPVPQTVLPPTVPCDLETARYAPSQHTLAPQAVMQ